mmetsp:Transcript_138127/g.335759  ORF Transcript_138127/g.335759 Transcript_138127/m.335759 type:complete len:110 (-) Transcript_138127:184-513(-)
MHSYHPFQGIGHLRFRRLSQTNRWGNRCNYCFRTTGRFRAPTSRFRATGHFRKLMNHTALVSIHRHNSTTTNGSEIAPQCPPFRHSRMHMTESIVAEKSRERISLLMVR